MAWELAALITPQCLEVAIVVKPRDGATCVGRSSEQPTLPTASLVGLVVEAGADSQPVRIKDHAIDSARVVSAGCRSSIVAKLSLPEGMQRGGESWLWMGLVCSAAPTHVERAKEVSAAISEWAAANWAAVVALEKAKQEAAEAGSRLRAAVSVAHDARAPLGAMSAMARGGMIGESDSEVFRAQLSYLDALLKRLSPQALSEGPKAGEESDACEVARRVARRFGPTVSLSAPHHAVWCAVAELDLERALSNIVGNAVEHSGGGAVQVAVLEQQQGPLSVVLSVTDSGPGFSSELLERFLSSGSERLPSAAGWGIGLASSRSKVEASGGSLRLLNAPGRGGVVEIRLQRSRGAACATRPYSMADSRAVLELSAAEAGYGPAQQSLCIIDDDIAHARSLAKLLSTRGISALCCSSVGEGIEELMKPGVHALCDAQMPDGGAQRLLESLRRRSLSRRVCVMSGAADDDLLYRLAALGAESFLLKPIESADIERWLGHADSQAPTSEL